MESEKYKILEISFNAISDHIKKAILHQRPIIIRHHNDSDGISGGFLIETACERLMKKNHLNPFKYLFRFPCKAPYYDFGDFLRDFNLIQRINERLDTKPLFIIIDNGSTDNDAFALSCLKTVVHDIIVIDHHRPSQKGDKYENDAYLTYHLNPYIFGFDNNISAGMLSYECAQKIFDISDLKILPAIAGIDDKCEGEEIQQYIDESGKNFEELKSYAMVVEFIITESRFDITKELMYKILEDADFRQIILQNAEQKKNVALRTAKSHLVEIDTHEQYSVYSFDITKYADQYSYPRSGKLSGMILREVLQDKKAFLMCVSDQSIIIRQSETIIPLSELILKLQESLPEAQLSGGGHDQAGSIHFLPGYKDEIIKKLIELLK